MTESIILSIDNLKELSIFAQKLASHLQSGDIILLKGNLGAGKTTLVTQIAHHMHADQPVTSPTFTLAQFYDIPTSQTQILHMDCYRLETASEFEELALEDYFPQSITFVEWGDKFCDIFEEFLQIEIKSISDSTRMLSFSGKGNIGKRLMANITKIKSGFENMPSGDFT